MPNDRGICRFYLLIFIITSCLAVLSEQALARDAVRRDVESYAIASCLTHQKQPCLKGQGDAWASDIVQRSRGNLRVLIAVDSSIVNEIAKGPMVVIRNDAGPDPDKTLPVAYCFEIVDRPSVRASIETAIKELAPAYKTKQ